MGNNVQNAFSHTIKATAPKKDLLFHIKGLRPLITPL